MKTGRLTTHTMFVKRVFYVLASLPCVCPLSYALDQHALRKKEKSRQTLARA